jgi:hypothetical protein
VSDLAVARTRGEVCAPPAVVVRARSRPDRWEALVRAPCDRDFLVRVRRCGGTVGPIARQFVRQDE